MTVSLRTTDASETWRALLTTYAGLNRLLTEEMEAETGLAMDRYEILLILSQAEDGSLRPSELADRRNLSRSGATRLIERLEHDGLVERRECESDGRGSLVVLTRSGEAAFRKAGRVHLRGIDEYVGSRLTVAEMSRLRGVLAKLADGAG